MNDDVYRNIDDVCETILAALTGRKRISLNPRPLTLALSPLAERGNYARL